MAEIEGLGGRWVTLDVASPQLDDHVHPALAAYGRVNVLVHNAGINIGGAVPDFRSDFQPHLWYPVPGSLAYPRRHAHVLHLTCQRRCGADTPERGLQGHNGGTYLPGCDGYAREAAD